MEAYSFEFDAQLAYNEQGVNLTLHAYLYLKFDIQHRKHMVTYGMGEIIKKSCLFSWD